LSSDNQVLFQQHLNPPNQPQLMQSCCHPSIGHILVAQSPSERSLPTP
jgi:hypothetical protein